MILGRPNELLALESMDNKLKAFNFECERISGHDYESILTGLDFLLNASKIPRVLIADTIKEKMFLSWRTEHSPTTGDSYLKNNEKNARGPQDYATRKTPFLIHL